MGPTHVDTLVGTPPKPHEPECPEEIVPGDNYTQIEITIECMRSNQLALLNFWVADDASKDVLTDGDNAIIPDCCYPTAPEDTPATKYKIGIRCKTECPEMVPF